MRRALTLRPSSPPAFASFASFAARRRRPPSILAARSMSSAADDDDAAQLPKNSSSRSRVVSERTLHATRWLKLKTLTYVDPDGTTREWDAVGRATTTSGASADAVCVFATLRKSGEEDTTLLVRQFRPPMRGETIELPAGLVDGDEAPEACALRELKEETGYVGVVTSAATPALPLSPGEAHGA